MQIAINVFEDRQTAQRAVDRLLHAGFEPDDVHLQASASRPSGTAPDADPRPGVLSSIGRFFAVMPGDDPPSGYADRYSEAVRRGHPVVVVEARDRSLAQQADAIMQESGAFDIDERFEQWKGVGLKVANNGNSAGRRKEADDLWSQEQGRRRDHSERERATASGDSPDRNGRENDLEARQTDGKPTGRP